MECDYLSGTLNLSLVWHRIPYCVYSETRPKSDRPSGKRGQAARTRFAGVAKRRLIFKIHVSRYNETKPVYIVGNEDREKKEHISIHLSSDPICIVSSQTKP